MEAFILKAIKKLAKQQLPSFDKGFKYYSAKDYHIYSHISQFFWYGKEGSQKHLNLYAHHISYQLKERCLTQHYRIQPNKIQSRNKIVTSVPTNPLLVNK